jgi:hypothetical protein
MRGSERERERESEEGGERLCRWERLRAIGPSTGFSAFANLA